MTRDAFKADVSRSLEDSIVNLEARLGVPLPRRLAFEWMSHPERRYIDDEIVDAITNHVYVDEEHIWACVDIGPTAILEDGRLLITGIRSGHAPRPYQPNWTGREGPFVLIYGGEFVKTTFHPGREPTMEAVIPEKLQAARQARHV